MHTDSNDHELTPGDADADAAPAPARAETGADGEWQRQAWEGARRAWLQRRGRVGKSRHTIAVYRIAFKQFFAWAEVPPWQVSAELAQGWAEHLVREGLADRTINLKLSAMSSFYEFVGNDYRAQTPDGRETALWPAERGNPFEAVDRPRTFPYRRPRPLSQAEVRAILAAINTECLTGRRDYALLVTILNTGRRPSEVLNLRWGDIQPSEEGGHHFTYRERGQVRWADLPATCYQAICAYLEIDGRPPERMGPGDYVFVAMNPALVKRLPHCADKPVQPNRPLSKCFANRILKKYARLVGVDPRRARVHHLRRVRAEGRLEPGWDLRWPDRR